MVDLSKICMGCMQEVVFQDGKCPNCGFSLLNYEKNRNARVLPAQTILAGKYLLGRVIGEGGFGITYLALELNLMTVMAIKEYFPTGLVTRDTAVNRLGTISVMGGEREQYFQHGLECFAQEARNLARFQNMEGIVSVRDFFLENKTAYMVMEYIEGRNLKQYLREKKQPLNEAETLRLMRPVLASLAGIHKEGIVHRDISPDNIIISDKGQVKLVDFGAARLATGMETQSLTVFLKPGYAPIEQYQTRGKQGPWTDIYAVCATMYEMMSGLKPEDSVNRMVKDNVKKLHEMSRQNPQIKISSRVSDAVQKGMQVHAAARFQTAEELMQALYTRQEPGPAEISGRPEQISGKTQKNPHTRRPGPAVIAGIAALALSVLAAGGILVRNYMDMAEGQAEEASVPAESEEASAPAESEEASAPAEPDEARELLVKDMIDPDTCGLMAYNVARDNQGTYYANALAGQEIDVDNYYELDLSELEEPYQYLRGTAIQNYDYAETSAYKTSISIYLDGEREYFYKPVDGYTQPEDFCLKLTGKQTLGICINGSNDLRLVDTALTNEPEQTKTARNTPEPYVNILEPLRVSEDISGIRDVLTARDNKGKTYYNVLAGCMADEMNRADYYLDKKYRRFTGKTILNYDYRKIKQGDTYAEIYVDGVLCYSSPIAVKGMQPDEFVIDVEDAEYLTICIQGRNCVRLADLKLE